MGTTIRLDPSVGGRDGYRGDFPLDRELMGPVAVDASRVGVSHPMFLIRLRLFVDWHLSAGHEVRVIPPRDARALQQLADMRINEGLPVAIFGDLPEPTDAGILTIRRLRTYHDVEDAAAAATTTVEEQVPSLAVWGDAAYMAISELCDNAILHGHNELGAYVAADRIVEPQPTLRLVIADLGIGIPEHIRSRHPEWHNDASAISQVLVRGVTGTGDPHRGNGYAEVLDQAQMAQLREASSALHLDIRSGKGRVGVRAVDGTISVNAPLATHPRRGTWITYEVLSVPA